MGFQPDIVGEFVNALLSDHGGVHVSKEQLLAPIDSPLHHNINADGHAQVFGDCALVYASFRGKGNVDCIGPEPLRRAGAWQRCARALQRSGNRV